MRPHWPWEPTGALQSQGWQHRSCCEGFVNAVFDCYWAGQEISSCMFTVVFLATSDWPQHLVLWLSYYMFEMTGFFLGCLSSKSHYLITTVSHFFAFVTDTKEKENLALLLLILPLSCFGSFPAWILSCLRSESCTTSAEPMAAVSLLGFMVSKRTKHLVHWRNTILSTPVPGQSC